MDSKGGRVPALLSKRDDRSLVGVASRLQLEQARRAIGLPLLDLWLRYSALGGMRTLVEVEAILQGEPVPGDHDRSLLAAALDERTAEFDRLRAVPDAGHERGVGSRS
jgi:hypothetical protein